MPETDVVWVPDARAAEVAPEMEMAHVDGVAWHDAPVPRRRHRCSPQTKAWYKPFDFIERCACGALRRNGGPWIDRNERRQSR